MKKIHAFKATLETLDTIITIFIIVCGALIIGLCGLEVIVILPTLAGCALAFVIKTLTFGVGFSVAQIAINTNKEEIIQPE
ncbi:hypothetical protein JK628_02790 [Shewanella sp. KX20019]|uniref:hypothetical protein n=1 Tax=Shewanella sp. KX20019 TaxID=2803864 RepID=UPI001926BF8C|nr:hypothetical protein [Shewanella sp. KX20019]QQX80816.1 hypothetical protein JK628_02790 [Shewanella sp. KX20019]